jgi:hypothetical protein
VDLEQRGDGAVLLFLIAAGEVPRDREAQGAGDGEDAAVALLELRGGEPAAEGVLDVGVGAGLIQHEITLAHARQVRRDRVEEMRGLRGLAVLLARRVVDDEIEAEGLDDILGAVAEMHVVIEDANTPDEPLLAQLPGRDDQAIEGAIDADRAVHRVVKAADRGAGGGAVFEGVPGRGDHGARRVGERIGHHLLAVEEAVVLPQREEIAHVLRVVSEGKIALRDGRGLVQVEGQLVGAPVVDHEGRLARARAINREGGHHPRGEEDRQHGHPSTAGAACRHRPPAAAGPSPRKIRPRPAPGKQAIAGRLAPRASQRFPPGARRRRERRPPGARSARRSKVPFMRYEEKIYRPPSEADAYILQATIGCSWNHCTYCDMYRDKSFRVRPLADSLADLDEAGRRLGGQVSKLFVADGDALVLPMDHWVPILDRARAVFPALRRASCYAMARNVLEKTDAELRELRERGLAMLYLGPESGDPATLRRIAKGDGVEEHVEAARKAREAGMQISVIALLGIGMERAEEHARATADLVTRMDPSFFSALTVTVVPGTPLATLENRGKFAVPPVPALLRELRTMVALARPTDAVFRTNHASNYLPLGGRLPHDSAQICQLIDAALAGRIPLRSPASRGL